MSSATTLLQSSDVESSSTTSEADTSSLEAALATTHTVKMLMDKGESKVSYNCSFETSKSSDVCQLRIKPLSLKFRPRYEAAGDEFWRAGLQLASMASSQQVSCDWRISRHGTTISSLIGLLVEEGCAAMQRAAACYVHAGLYIRCGCFYYFL